MGRKDKNKKKGKGAEKTSMKTDKKLVAKQKKLLAKLGEEDIENIVAKYETKDTKSSDLTEIVCPPPTARVNVGICAHPGDKEEIFIHGGEFFNGQQTVIYGDFYSYNVAKNEWKTLKSSICPAPRSGHQMVSVATDGGQIWLFGGEYASPSQLQFYHFRDLWVYRMVKKQWEKLNAPNGPSARSGHRMVVTRKKLFVFGGFHDNNASYRYFNDLYAFSLENYSWTKIDAVGTAPPARSGCCMVANTDGKILIWGGYSKTNVKKEIDRGTTHTDMFALVADKQDAKGNSSYKWTSIKPSGKKPAPRSGMAVAIAPNGKAYAFGGVMDTEEDEEDVRGLFSNELHALDTGAGTWRKLELTAKARKAEKSKATDVDMNEEEKQSPEAKKIVSDDGVFTMTIGGSGSGGGGGSKGPVKEDADDNGILDLGGPSPRMNAATVVCKGQLYVYGGLFESGSRQFTLSDLYSLDLHKVDVWKTLIANSLNSSEWLGSDSEGDSSDDDEEDDDDDDDDDDEDDDDSSEDDSSGMETE
ncbi:kelch domain-containing protein 4 [Anopheles moucheti]|uniref:kelch domain-containing protein 4 n=1 Tax=Anopheles moucheti TaxID=186751 RepID=UPI0022EFDF82|nr:kelch domain-containing protein 4 [Anopheles moucheti]